MTKDQFMNKLKQHLKKIPKQDLDDILWDYEEYFQNAQNDGKLEHEIVQSLGSPKQLAKELLATYYINEVQKYDSVGNIFRAVWAGVGLGFLNLIFILGPFIAMVATVAAFWITAFVFVLTPFLVILKAAISIESFIWFEFFLALSLAGIGILLLIGLYYISGMLKKWTIQYLKINVAIVKGENVHA